MSNYDIHLEKLDELCDLLDQRLVFGNIINHCIPNGEPYIEIWKGPYGRRLESDFCESDILFKIFWWPVSEKYSLKVLDKEYDEEIRSLWQPAYGMPGAYLFKTPQAIVDTIKILFSHKENNMKEFTLETVLFGKLKEKGIYYKFDNGVYNPRSIIITTKMNYNICRVKSIPADLRLRSYWVNWFGVPTEILVDLKIDRTTYYDWSDELIEDILKIEKKLKPGVRLNAYAYAEADVLATEVIHKYRNYGIVDVIFNDPATIVIWADGSKTVVKANGEKFDPEKGLAMAISKKVLGNKHDYYELFKKHAGRYEKKQKKQKKE